MSWHDCSVQNTGARAECAISGVILRFCDQNTILCSKLGLYSRFQLGKILAEVSNIKVQGLNKWKTLTQTASLYTYD